MALHDLVDLIGRTTRPGAEVASCCPPTFISYLTKHGNQLLVRDRGWTRIDATSLRNHDSELASNDGHAGQYFLRRTSIGGLVPLGQLSEHHNLVNRQITECLKRINDPMWSLEEDDVSLATPPNELNEPLFSVITPMWWKSHKRKGSALDSRSRKGGHHRTRPRNRLHPEPGVRDRPDHLPAGVRNGRRAGIGHEGHRLALPQTLDHRPALPPLVVFPNADQPGGNLEVPQELTGAPGVFGRDDGDFPEDSERPEGDVLQVADGRGDHVQRPSHTAHFIVPLRDARSPSVPTLPT